MITASLRAWRTDLSLTVRHAPSAALERNITRLLHQEIARTEALASRFRSDSEVSAVNALAGEWVEVTWGFVAILTACLDAAKATGGLVDPTLGTAIKAAGYDRWAQEHTGIPAKAGKGRYRAVGIRPGRAQAQVRIPAGTALDLGSVTKGWLADRLATAVAGSGYEVCANMGGDIRVIADDHWTVWADSELPGVAAAPVDLLNGGLATSGVGRRAWQDGHHIIDPRTGLSARTPWHCVSAVAATAADANAAATAGVILAVAGPDWLARLNIDARFVSVNRIITTGRWPSQETAA